MPRKPVIPAQAGIQKREQFFVTLHNTSWVRDYWRVVSSTTSQVRHGPRRWPDRVVVAAGTVMR